MTFHEYIRADLVKPSTRPPITEEPDVHSYDRELGILSAKMAAVESDVAEMRKDVRDMRDTMKDALAQTRGGWRVVMAVGAIFTAIGAGLAKFMPVLLQVAR
jgi:hypothetical protein